MTWTTLQAEKKRTTMHSKKRRPLTEASRGSEYCPDCGGQIKWVRLLSGRYIAVDPEPVMYIDGGRDWLVERTKYEADIKNHCRIWRPGMLTGGIKYGYKPHKWTCGRKV